jgi:glutamyl-tRNA reductase
MIDNVLARDPEKRLVIIDLAIPRDVAYDNGSNPNVEVHDLEAIKSFVKDQQARRVQAIPQAEEIIERKLAEFTYWFEHVRYEPLYNGLEESFETIRQQEIAFLHDKLPPGLQVELDQATRQLVDHLLHLKARASQKAE